MQVTTDSKSERLFCNFSNSFFNFVFHEFQKKFRINFNDLGFAVGPYTNFIVELILNHITFQVISLEGWVDIMYFVMDAYSFYSFIYFILLIVVSVLAISAANNI